MSSKFTAMTGDSALLKSWEMNDICFLKIRDVAACLASSESSIQQQKVDHENTCTVQIQYFLQR